jgi:hypothetical protein
MRDHLIRLERATKALDSAAVAFGVRWAVRISGQYQSATPTDMDFFPNRSLGIALEIAR